MNQPRVSDARNRLTAFADLLDRSERDESQTQMRDDLRALLASTPQHAGPVAWPSEMVNHPDAHDPKSRIVGFRIRPDDPQFGNGLSEPLAWLRSVTIGRATPDAADAARWREALEWIARVNACDYEYQRKARAALALQGAK